jgi:hypothetical protein
LLLKAGCWSFSALFYLCRGTELVTFKWSLEDLSEC